MVGRTASGTSCATSIRKEAKQRVPLVSRARSRGSRLPSSLGREGVCGGDHDVNGNEQSKVTVNLLKF